MTTHVDTSALMKRYVEEDGSDIAEAWLRADPVHLASAQRLQVPGLTFLTFDLRQAQAARSLGFTVVGV